MPATSTTPAGPIVVSALTLRTSLGRILRRVNDGRSLVVEKRGTPAAVLLNIRDYVKLAAPEPEILKIIGAEAKRNKTSALTPRQIDRIIQSARSAKKKR
jgi:prevent-host-death family protein